MNHVAAFKALRSAVTNYLMDVGIDAKVAETRILPKVPPIHGIPKAVATAPDGMIVERCVISASCTKPMPPPKVR